MVVGLFITLSRGGGGGVLIKKHKCKYEGIWNKYEKQKSQNEAWIRNVEHENKLMNHKQRKQSNKLEETKHIRQFCTHSRDLLSIPDLLL